VKSVLLSMIKQNHTMFGPTDTALTTESHS